MLGEMLSSGKIDGYSASGIIDHALKSGDEASKHEASNHLVRYPEVFLGKNGHANFPECLLYECNKNLSLSVRQDAAAALIQIMAERKKEEWNEGVLGNLILTLYAMWAGETEDLSFKKGLGHCLSKITKIYPNNRVLKSHHQKVIIGDLKKELDKEKAREVEDCPYFTNQLSKLLDNWVKQSGGFGK